MASGKANRLGMGLLFVVMALSSLAAGRIALVTARGSAGEVTGLDLRQVTGVNIQQPENEESLPVTDTAVSYTHLWHYMQMHHKSILLRKASFPHSTDLDAPTSLCTLKTAYRENQ